MTTPSTRGFGAARKHRETPRARKVSVFFLKPGESRLFRPRGLNVAPVVQPRRVLETLPLAALKRLLVDLAGVFPGKEARSEADAGKKKAAYIDAILRRYTQIEPYLCAQHFVNRLRGRPKTNKYRWCMDPQAAIDGRADSGDCLMCQKNAQERKQSPVGWASVCNGFTVFNMAKRHLVGAKKDDKDSGEWVDCEAEEKGVCPHCDRNGRLVAKGKEPDREFYRGIQAMLLSDRNAELFTECAVNVSHLCRNTTTDRAGKPIACGGKLKPLSAACGACGEEVDLNAALGDTSNFAVPEEVRCRICRETTVPEMTFECNRCEEGKPARLMDCVIRASRTSDEKNTAYAYALESIEPLDPENLAHRPVWLSQLIEWESYTRPPSDNDVASVLNMKARIQDDDDDDDDDDRPQRRSGRGGAPSAVKPRAGYFSGAGGGARSKDEDDEGGDDGGRRSGYDGDGDDDVPF